MNSPKKKCSDSKKLNTRIFIVRTLLCIIIIVFGIIVYFIFSSLKNPPKEKDPERLRRSLLVVPVKLKNIRVEIKGYGTVRPQHRIKMSTEVSGRVIYTILKIKGGFLVKKGDVLLKIDKSDYEIAFNKSESEIERLSAIKEKQTFTIRDKELLVDTAVKKLEIARQNFERQKKLHHRQVISRQKLEDAENQLENDRSNYINKKGDFDKEKIELKVISAQLEIARATRRKEALNLERCVIKSPVDGRIENLAVHRGEYVKNGQRIFDVVDDSTLEIPVAITADDARYILDLEGSNKQTYKNWIKYLEDVKVLIQWGWSTTVYETKGEVSGIESFNSDTRAVVFLVTPLETASKQKTSFPLVSGIFCSVVFYGREIPNAMKIPWSAVQLNGSVYTVDEGGKVIERKVQILQNGSDSVIIVSGLKDGEYVVVQEIPQGVVNGTIVKRIEQKIN